MHWTVEVDLLSSVEGMPACSTQQTCFTGCPGIAMPSDGGTDMYSRIIRPRDTSYSPVAGS